MPLLSTNRNRRILFHDARRFIQSHLGDRDLTLTVATKELLVSRRQLQRALEHCGTTFTEELRRARLDRALNLLASELPPDKRSVREIAARVGYGSGSVLTKAFRREFGISPSQVDATEAQSILTQRAADEINRVVDVAENLASAPEA